MIKTILKYLLFGAAVGCILFVLDMIRLDLMEANGLQNRLDNFTIYAIGSMAMGTGFGGGAIIYKFEHLALWVQIAINLFVGFVIYFIIGFGIGIISLESPISVILNVFVNSFIFIVLLALVSFLFSVREAKVINKKLKECNPD